MIRDTLVQYITVVKCVYDAIVVIKVSSEILLTDDDVFVICCYLVPGKSNYHKLYDCDLFFELGNVLETYSALG